MTDHNAEGGKVEIEPCAYCSQVPEVSGQCYGHGYINEVCDCFPFDNQYIYQSQWNDMQRRIMQRRRKDFEAAREREQGVGDVYRTFDDYIARYPK